MNEEGNTLTTETVAGMAELVTAVRKDLDLTPPTYNDVREVRIKNAEIANGLRRVIKATGSMRKTTGFDQDADLNVSKLVDVVTTMAEYHEGVSRKARATMDYMRSQEKIQKAQRRAITKAADRLKIQRALVRPIKNAYPALLAADEGLRQEDRGDGIATASLVIETLVDAYEQWKPKEEPVAVAPAPVTNE